MNPTDAPTDSPLSEADIQAYADGTLSPARAAFLRDYLGRDPAEARRVAFYGKLNEQMQRSFQTADEPAAGAFNGRRDSGSRWGSALRLRLRKPLRALVALVIACIAVSGWLAATEVTRQALNNAAIMRWPKPPPRHFPPHRRPAGTRPPPTWRRSDCGSWISASCRSVCCSAPPNSSI